MKWRSLKQLADKFRWEIGVDLGTSNTLVYLGDKGIIIDEPTMLARLKRKRWTGLGAPRTKLLPPLAYGFKAKEMLNREPRQIEVVAPLKNGVISDLEAVESLVAYYLKLITEVPSEYPKLFKPRVWASVPSSVTEVQKRSVKSVFLRAGAREVIVGEGVVLAAVGAGMSLSRDRSMMVVDLGGGKTEVAVVAEGGVVVGKGTKVSGDDMTQAIINYIRIKYGLLIGENTAERVKIEVGGVIEQKDGTKKTSLLRGRDLESGLPRGVKVSDGEVREAITFEFQKIVTLIKEVLDETPPELMDEILKKGIVLVGNGAKLGGVERLIESETKIATRVADEPGLCVIKGCGWLMEKREGVEMVSKMMTISS